MRWFINGANSSCQYYSMTISYRHIHNQSDFQNLQARWQRFIETTTGNSIYLTWEWLYRWWEVYQEDRTLCLLIAEQGQELVGVFPLLKKRIYTYGIIPITRVEFLSTGENEEEEVCPTFMGIAIKCGLEEPVCKGFCLYLTSTLFDEHDELLLDPLLGNDPVTGMLVKYLGAESHYKVTETISSQNIVTRLGDELEKSFCQSGKKSWKEIKKKKKEIEEAEGSSYRFLERTEDFTEYFNRFIELHNSYWDNNGAFANEKYCKFQEKVCRDFYRNGWLKLSFLEIDKRVVAGNLDYCFNETVYGYQTAFDKHFKTKLSLGFTSMIYCLKNAISEGYKHYDWYRYYGEDDSQQQFNLEKRDIVVIRCRKRSIKNLVRNTADSLIKIAKKFI